MPADETNDLLRETFRKFALDRLLPNYQRWKTESFDPDLLRELGRLGALGIAIPEEYGGSGGTRVQLGIAAEEIGRGDFNVTGFLQIGAITELLLRHADEPLRRQWLPPLASGEAIPSFGLTEPSVGSDAAKLQMTARRDGSDWVLRGEKASITFAGLASVCMVFARTGGDGARGISVFAVPLDFPGVARQVYTSAGGTLVQRGSLFFDDVRIPAA